MYTHTHIYLEKKKYLAYCSLYQTTFKRSESKCSRLLSRFFFLGARFSIKRILSSNTNKFFAGVKFKSWIRLTVSSQNIPVRSRFSENSRDLKI